MSASPALLADRAVAHRLFGDYPYGRVWTGTPDTLARIERADLLHARERFLNPNNSTLVIIGGIDDARAVRALRRLLGGWEKSDTTVPATFRQPDAPDARTLIVDLPGTDTAEVRLATRGLARSDKDYASATLLAILARDLWLSTQPDLTKSAFFVRHEAHVLPGIHHGRVRARSSSFKHALKRPKGSSATVEGRRVAGCIGQSQERSDCRIE